MADAEFNKLVIRDWRQFASVEIQLHSRLTVLTGANGGGKTTLLNLLTQHFGWSRPLLSTPWRDETGAIQYLSGVFRRLKELVSNRQSGQQSQIGEIVYTNGEKATLWVPTSGGVQYSIDIRGQQQVRGLSIPSHRVISHYQQINSIPTAGIGAREAFANYQSEVLNRYQGGHTGYSPIFRMKEALISMATFGAGNAYVQGQPKLLEAYLGFVRVLKRVLPASLGFERLDIRTPDVVMVTRSGEFLIDAVSGGLSAIIDLAWQIHTFSLENERFVVVIDEPENHLHPSMQRELLPGLLSAFPQVQFVVATHSPFVVTAVRDSNVYVLAYQDGTLEGTHALAPARSVESIRLDQVNKAGTANEVLRNVLGVETTLPLWASKELDGIIERYRTVPFGGAQVSELNEELARLGMSDSLPMAVDAILSDRGGQ